MPEFIETHRLVIGLSSIVVLGIGAQWLAWRLRAPSILLLLICGFLAGNVPLFGDFRLIDSDALFGDVLTPLVSISVALILFEGGLTLRFSELHEAGTVVRRLCSVGALVTWIGATGAAHWLIGLSLTLSVLFGAVLVVTGPTVIGPLLQHVRPSGATGPILKWEGIVIDPIGALLAVLVFEFISASGGESEFLHTVWAIFATLVFGGSLGMIGAWLLALLLRRYWIPDFLQASVALMLAIAVFTLSNLIQEESGLLAVTLMGLVLANQRWTDVRHIVEFKENLRVLLISSLFILLAARIRFADFHGLSGSVIAFVLVLILLVRPLSVWAATVGTRLTWRERLFLAWMAPRGIVAAAVSSVFALELEHRGLQEAEQLVPLTFAVIIATVSIYGLTAAPLARWLNLTSPNPQGVLLVGAHAWARKLAEVLKNKKFRVLLVDSNRQNTHAARMAGLDTYHGNVLSEAAMHDLDLGGLGRLLALTPNDAVNALAAQRFLHAFGRKEVYRLPAPEKKKLESSPMGGHGRVAFAPTATFGALQTLFASGATIKATPLTEEFNYDAFQERYHQHAVPMFVITKTNRLLIVTAADAVQPQPGHTLIAAVPVDVAREADAASARPDDAGIHPAPA